VPDLLKIRGKGEKIEEMFDLQMLKQALAVGAAKLIVDTMKMMRESKEPKVVQDNELFA